VRRRANSSFAGSPENIELVRIDPELIGAAEIDAIERLMFDCCEKLFVKAEPAASRSTSRSSLQPRHVRDSNR